jgi:tripartite-type tricarboxylate transporter receptor subunit TctC
MKLPRRKFLHLAAGAAALPAASRIAAAQAYPTRPVRWIIGFPAGGGADTVARIVGPWLSERLGHQVVVENRPGASSNIAVQAVVNSPPDGYTLLFYGASALVNTITFASLPFDLRRDIVPVCGLVAYPMVLVAHPSAPAKTVAELIAYAKANPGKVTMASFGSGSASHLAGELFKMMAGINMVHVPYRGGAPMVTDLVGGQVQVGFDVMVTSLPHIRSGKLKALGVLGQDRFNLLPDVPTIAETVPGYEAGTWAGVGAPRGTPPEIIERLNREISAALADPAIKARLAEVGTLPMILTTAQFGAFISAEAEKWAKVVKFAGIKAE